MILTGDEIIRQVSIGSIVISPFCESQVTSNSYDFRLQNRLLRYVNSPLDTKEKNDVQEIELSERGIVLAPGDVYLGATVERMGSSQFVPIIRGRSSIAKLGLCIHATADLIDLGSINHWTLQLIPTIPVRIYAGMKIGQATFWSVIGSLSRQYDGKYSGSIGPVSSKSYLDNERRSK